jgi:hypothetical protein
MSDTTETVDTDLAARVEEFNANRKPGGERMASNGMIYGPGDVAEVIDEPDYEKSLKISADLFGGTPEDYRTPGMTQEAWAAIGSPEAPSQPVLDAVADTVSTGIAYQQDLVGVPLTQSGLGGWIPENLPGIRFFDNLDALAPCCQATLGTATESIAVLEDDLVRKALDALGKATEAACANKDAAGLVSVALAYMALAAETAS